LLAVDALTAVTDRAMRNAVIFGCQIACGIGMPTGTDASAPISWLRSTTMSSPIGCPPWRGQYLVAGAFVPLPAAGRAAAAAAAFQTPAHEVGFLR
jgi:hypothetical protein